MFWNFKSVIHEPFSSKTIQETTFYKKKKKKKLVRVVTTGNLQLQILPLTTANAQITPTRHCKPS